MNILKQFFYCMLMVFFISCGIEDTIYFKEPSNISVDYDINNKNPVISFYGYNQEKPDGQYLFVGYDLFYYFTTPETSKKAAVFNSIPYLNSQDPVTSRNKNLITVQSIKGSRPIYQLFPTADATNDSVSEAANPLLSIYKYVTIPVTESIIENILTEANTNNVKIYFHDDSNNDKAFSNPYVEDSKGDDYIFIDRIYPNSIDYPEGYDADFKGFLDPTFYKKLLQTGGVVSPISDDGEIYTFRCYFYLVAKGFDILSRTSLNTFTNSINSSTFTVDFIVDMKGNLN